MLREVRLQSEEEETLEAEEGNEMKETAAVAPARRGSLLEPVGKPPDDVVTVEDDRDLDRGLGSEARVAPLDLHMGEGAIR